MLRRHLIGAGLIAAALPALAACSASEAGKTIREAASRVSDAAERTFSGAPRRQFVCGGVLPLHSTGSACAVDPAFSGGWEVRSFDLLDAVRLEECEAASPRLELVEILPGPPRMLCRYLSAEVEVVMQRAVPEGSHCTPVGGLDPAGLPATFDCD